MTSRLLPILFNQTMNLRVLLEDKTETRRLILPQPVEIPQVSHDSNRGMFILARVEGKENPCKCFPKYNVGDILYVRETWQQVYETEPWDDDPRGYKDIHEMILNFDEIPKVAAGMSTESSTRSMAPRMKYYIFKSSDIKPADDRFIPVWRPSIHMPREAARTFLEVTDVYPQKLQETTVEDILHEGVNWVQPPPICQKPITYPNSFPRGFDDWSEEKKEDWIKSTARAEYVGWMEYAKSVLDEWEKLWDSTISKNRLQTWGYAANPWVWVYKFKLLKEGIDVNVFTSIKRRWDVCHRVDSAY